VSDAGLGAGLAGSPSIGGPGAVQQADRLGPESARERIGKALVVGALLFTLLSLVRWITDEPKLTASSTFGTALRLAVPILLAALGGLFSERSGVVNIGLEGMMILGTWFGAWGAWQYGPWWGVLIGILGGALGGLLHALATVTFNVDHIISGVAIITLAQGSARYLSVVTYEGVAGGGATQSPRVTDVGDIDLPLLAGGDLFGWHSPDVLGSLERHHWLLVSDAAGVLRGFTANLSWLTLIAILLVPFTSWLLWRTVFGLRLRSAGEDPNAADSLGVPVYRMKYAGVLISGCLAGLAGAFLSIEAAGIYRQGQTGGRGFIGLAAMLFGNWRPYGAAAGAGLFGFSDALQLTDKPAVHALLLFVCIGALGYAAFLLSRHRTRGAIGSAVVGVVFGLWFFTSDTIADQIVNMTPYVVTLVVLSVATQRLRAPAADGKRWRKGQAE